MNNAIIGVDYSITSPAAAVITNSAIKLYAWNGKKHLHWASAHVEIQVIPYPDYTTEIERLSKLAKAMYDEVFLRHVGYNHYVFIEGYSFGATGKVFNIAEGCGIFKHMLWNSGLTCTELSPGTIKKFATGAGNAKKPEMIEAFNNHTGIDLYEIFGKKKGLKTIPSPLSDLADAYWVAQCGASHPQSP